MRIVQYIVDVIIKDEIMNIKRIEMKKILLIATGGTIASVKSDHGLVPKLSSQNILDCIPKASEICDIETIQLMNIDSTNINPSHWLEISKTIEENYDLYDGFVITHGTDTMAYTAAALSYLVQFSKKPVVITGSQKSIASDNTDAKRNLKNALQYASADGSHGVSLVFDGKVILGTRSRKERTKSFNAFSSVDFPEVAIIRDNMIIRYLTNIEYKEKPVFYHKMEERVLLLTLIPGMKSDILLKLMDDYEGLILQSYGVGGLPNGGDGALESAVEKWIECGKKVVMSTQVPYEGSDMEKYQVGYQIKQKYEIIEAYNMSTEAIVTKLMWALGQTSDTKEVKKIINTSVHFDII